MADFSKYYWINQDRQKTNCLRWKALLLKPILTTSAYLNYTLYETSKQRSLPISVGPRKATTCYIQVQLARAVLSDKNQLAVSLVDGSSVDEFEMPRRACDR